MICIAGHPGRIVKDHFSILKHNTQFKMILLIESQLVMVRVPSIFTPFI